MAHRRRGGKTTLGTASGRRRWHTQTKGTVSRRLWIHQRENRLRLTEYAISAMLVKLLVNTFEHLEATASERVDGRLR